MDITAVIMGTTVRAAAKVLLLPALLALASCTPREVEASCLIIEAVLHGAAHASSSGHCHGRPVERVRRAERARGGL